MRHCRVFQENDININDYKVRELQVTRKKKPHLRINTVQFLENIYMYGSKKGAIDFDRNVLIRSSDDDDDDDVSERGRFGSLRSERVGRLGDEVPIKSIQIKYALNYDNNAWNRSCLWLFVNIKSNRLASKPNNRE